MRPYAERKAARIDRLRASAAKLTAEGEARIARARQMADVIPLGQPTMFPAHHSHGRDMAFRARIRAGFDRGFEALDAAKDAAARADAAEQNRAVSSDDPEAVAALRTKRDKLTAERDLAKRINAAVRKPEPRDALAALGLSQATIDAALKPDFAGRVGVPDYRLRNLGSEIRRIDQRIAELEARAAAPTPEPETIAGVKLEEADNRVRLRFPGKPSAEVRAALKAAGFRWAPSEGAWQRMASPEAQRVAREILARLP